MLEKLYTRKVIIALMALILAANGFLLYQFQIKPPTQTANTPSSEESPGVPETPEENIENAEANDAPNEDEADDEENGDSREPEDASEEPSPNPPDSPPERPEDEAPILESAPEEQAATPFDSQYGSPPTAPDSIGGSGDPSRIRVALASFYDPADGSGDSSSEISILPATSGFVPLSALAVCAIVLVGAVIVLMKRK